MGICQVCGKANAEDARFCFNCGTPLSRIPPVKVEVKSPITGLPFASGVSAMGPAPPIYPPRQVARLGSCYYHPELSSMAVCSRCGRSICAGCTKPYGVLNFCPECFYGLSSRIGSGSPQYAPSLYPSQYPGYQYSMEPQPQDQQRSWF
jgi:hypothetical protein